MIITILSNVSSSIPQEQKVLKVKVTQWCPILCNPMDYSLWNSLGQNTGVGSLSLLQAIFPTQGSNPGLPHCEWIFYQLSYKGSPRILEWVAYPFFRGSSQPRNWTRVSCIAGGFFTNWVIRGKILAILKLLNIYSALSFSPVNSKGNQSIKPVNPKGNQSWIFIGGIDAEAETP